MFVWLYVLVLLKKKLPHVAVGVTTPGFTQELVVIVQFSHEMCSSGTLAWIAKDMICDAYMIYYLLNMIY